MARMFSIVLALLFLALAVGLLLDGTVRGDGLAPVNAVLALIAGAGVAGSAWFALRPPLEYLEFPHVAPTVHFAAGAACALLGMAMIMWLGSSSRTVATSLALLVCASLAWQMAAHALGRRRGIR